MSGVMRNMWNGTIPVGLLMFVVLPLTQLPQRAWGQNASVEFELCTEPGVGISASQEWLAALKDLGLSGLRVRAATGVDRPEVQKKGTSKSPSFRVIGIITADGQLKLPNGSFGMNDKRRLNDWLKKLKASADDDPATKKGAFGLTNKQLVEIHEALAAPVTIETLGQPPQAVAKKITAGLPLNLTVDPDAGRLLAGETVVEDELRGISSGTALAALLRPLGLVLVPALRGSSAQLRITTARQADELWPIGWPKDENADKAVPQLFKIIEVEIDETPLADALESIQKRLKVPFLYDHNGLARQRIDLQAKQVSFRKGKASYGRILDRLLSQSRLQWELRFDEADNPLIWISPGK